MISMADEICQRCEKNKMPYKDGEYAKIYSDLNDKKICRECFHIIVENYPDGNEDMVVTRSKTMFRSTTGAGFRHTVIFYKLKIQKDD